MLPLQTPQPDSLLWAPDLDLRILGQCQVVRSMRPLGALQFLAGGQDLQPILADGRQHQQARFLPLLLHLAQQALVHERRHPVQYVCWQLTQSRRETLHRFQGTATSKHGEAPEEPLLLNSEQIIAPCQCVAQGLLPDRGIACSARQHLQAMSQACQECLWGEEFAACRGQFDGQRQPIQAHTDLGDSSGVGGSHLEVGTGSLHTLKEEGYCRILGEGLASWKMGEVGERQWRDGKLVFPTDMQHGTAGYQDLELRAVSQQVRKPRCRCGYLLEVVEEQQQALVLQISLQKTRYWLLSGFFDPQCLSNRGNDQVEIANGSQWDKADAVGIVIEQLSRYLEPQARFADTTGTREGQQTHLRVSQECVYCRHLLLASN